MMRETPQGDKQPFNPFTNHRQRSSSELVSGAQEAQTRSQMMNEQHRQGMMEMVSENAPSQAQLDHMAPQGVSNDSHSNYVEEQNNHMNEQRRKQNSFLK